MLYGTLAPTGAGSADIHPLGYYTILWIWMKVFGESLVATRLLSIIAGLISVYLIYLIAFELLSDPKTARLSMLFAALAPFQIHYAQEIRMYSFLVMWLLLATYSYQRGSKTRNWKWWLLFSVSAAFAQYTHNLAAFYLIALALLPIFQKNWQVLRAVFLASGALAIGLDSTAEPGPALTIASTLLGTWFALLLVLVNVVHYSSLAAEKNKQWLHIALRVAGSWIIAISVLVLAFALRKH